MLNEDSYLDFVMEEANKINMFFLVDSGEGNGIIDPITGWYIENLSGWLIKSSDKERLLKSKENGTAYDEFSNSYIFAIWSKTSIGKLEITFKKY